MGVARSHVKAARERRRSFARSLARSLAAPALRSLQELASRLGDENRRPKHSDLVGSVLKTAVIFGPVIGFISDRLFS